MTADEARKVAGILAEADDGCHVCASKLAAAAVEEFPDHDWFALVGRVLSMTADGVHETAKRFGAA